MSLSVIKNEETINNDLIGLVKRIKNIPQANKTISTVAGWCCRGEQRFCLQN
jgi:hypothetical protein